MPAVSRKGDPNGAGGVITGPCSSNVFANGINVSLPGDGVTPHAPCPLPAPPHCSASTSGGSPTVFANGKPIIRVGADSDTCGHARAAGSPNVFCQ